MQQHWLDLIKGAALRIAGLKRYWKVLCGFVSRVSLLNETREARQIENMSKYLEAVSKQLAAMKKSGCPDDVIRDLAVRLNVPLIQANLEAMVIARQFSTAKSRPDDEDEHKSGPNEPKERADPPSKE